MDSYRYVEFATEVRDDAPVGISGTVLRYGDVATIGQFSEEFRPGSIRQPNDVIANLMHDRAKPVARTGSGLELHDDGAELRALITVPSTTYGREAEELVKHRILRGFSVEFRSHRDRWEGNHRIIEDASITGIGIVDRPAYAASEIAVRMKNLRGARVTRPPVAYRRVWV